MKKKQFYSLFINVLVLIFCLSCASQNVTPEVADQYKVINTHFKNDTKIRLNVHTATDYVNESILKTLDAWNDANVNLDNINRDNIDFNKLFVEEEFKIHIDSFLSIKKIRLNQKLISSKVVLKNKTKNIISFPYVFVSSKNRRYALLYSETIQGPENGSGEVYLYEKMENDWVLVFVFSLWIS